MATSVDSSKTGDASGGLAAATADDVDAGLSESLAVTPKALADSDSFTGKQDAAEKDAAGGYVGKTLEKINFWNAARTFMSFLVNASTAARTYTFQDRNGIIADDTDLALKENVANKSTDIALGDSDVLYPTQRAAKTYMDGLVVGLLNDRGNHDASSNTFPSTGGSGSGGAIKKGNTWFVSVAGTLGGVAVNIGDTFRARVDTPGQTAGNWAILEANIGYVPERSIDAASSKATPVDADYFGVIDSAAGNALKKTSWANIKATIWSSLGSLIAGGTSKATPIDADTIPLSDSAASDATKKLTWANLKATLKTYFDTLYGPSVTISAVVNMAGIAATTQAVTVGAKTVNVFVSLCDAGNASRPRVQLRYGGSTFKTTGYVSEIIEVAGTASQSSFTTGFYLSKTANATAVNSGVLTLKLVDATNNKYQATWTGLQNLGGTKYNTVMFGEVTLGAGNTLDAVKFEDESGNNFDSGSVSFSY